MFGSPFRVRDALAGREGGGMAARVYAARVAGCLLLLLLWLFCFACGWHRPLVARELISIRTVDFPTLS